MHNNCFNQIGWPNKTINFNIFLDFLSLHRVSLVFIGFLFGNHLVVRRQPSLDSILYCLMITCFPQEAAVVLHTKMNPPPPSPSLTVAFKFFGTIVVPGLLYIWSRRFEEKISNMLSSHQIKLFQNDCGLFA